MQYTCSTLLSVYVQCHSLWSFLSFLSFFRYDEKGYNCQEDLSALVGHLHSSKVQKLFNKLCCHLSLFQVHRSVVMNHRFGLFQEVHATTFLQWLPVFLREFPQEKLEPFCLRSTLGVVSSMEIYGLLPLLITLVRSSNNLDAF